MADKSNLPDRQKMQRCDPRERAKNFSEVALGYTDEQALAEAQRCLQCSRPLCVEGCPVRVDIPGFIEKIVEGQSEQAAERIKQTNILPAICGRVCPQEDQCEKLCILGNKTEPVNIGALERYVGDKTAPVSKDSLADTPVDQSISGKAAAVAVVGSGPSGLTCAADLLRMGYQVTIFEALHEPGGVLVYGIPEFRLPNSIVRGEVEYLKKLGADFQLNVLVGRTVTVDQLLEDEGFSAVYLAAGAGTPWFMGIPGENLPGIYSANEFLTRLNLMRAHRSDHATPIVVGNRVVVIGGGNVALDAARSAVRVGAQEVRVVYRRSRAEMPARKMEIEHAEEEGVIFDFLTNPLKFYPDQQGFLGKIEVVDMKLGEPDESGRPRPFPVDGSNRTWPVDTAVIAIGSRPNRIVGETTPGLSTTEANTIEIDPPTGQTSRPEVFAGGDVVTGSDTVIAAMGAGRRAARSIDRFLQEDSTN